MLHTVLTTDWGLTYPLVSASMAGAASGRLARAVSSAGGLGMIGVGSTTAVSAIEADVDIARGDDRLRFGMGLMIWAVERRPELLDAVLAARPFLASVSFGDPKPYVDRLHGAGILVATQVNSREQTARALDAGVDMIVAQGTEAGGHTGHVATLPLLQVVLDAVAGRCPVLAAGGIASPRGLAAVLIAGAEGAWIGTSLLGSPEATVVDGARERILHARETDTVLTRAFDVTWGAPWPEENASRVLRNRFTDLWTGREDRISDAPDTRSTLQSAVDQKDYSLAPIPAGQAVGLVHESEPAARIIERIGRGAEEILLRRSRALLSSSP